MKDTTVKRLIYAYIAIPCIGFGIPFLYWNAGIASFSITNLILYLLAIYALKSIFSNFSIYKPYRSILFPAVFLVIYSVLFILILYNTGINNYLLGYQDNSRFILPFIKITPYLHLPSAVLIGIYLSKHTFYLSKINSTLLRFLALALFGYIVFNFIKYGSSFWFLHNAFVACLAQIFMATWLYRALSTHLPNKRLLYLAGSIIAFSIPFLGSLRGASVASLIGIFFVFINSNLRANTVFILMFVTILLFILQPIIFSNYSSYNSYGYSSPTEVVSKGFNTEEKTAQLRLEWWEDAIHQTYSKSIFWGHQMNYTFARTSTSEVSSSTYLHSFYVTAFADGGLLLITPLFLLIINLFKLSFKKLKTKSEVSIWMTWIFVILWEHTTNTYAFSVTEASIQTVIIIIATANIVSSK